MENREPNRNFPVVWHPVKNPPCVWCSTEGEEVYHQECQKAIDAAMKAEASVRGKVVSKKKKHSWCGFGEQMMACFDCGKPYDGSLKWNCSGQAAMKARASAERKR